MKALLEQCTQQLKQLDEQNQTNLNMRINDSHMQHTITKESKEVQLLSKQIVLFLKQDRYLTQLQKINEIRQIVSDVQTEWDKNATLYVSALRDISDKCDKMMNQMRREKKLFSNTIVSNLKEQRHVSIQFQTKNSQELLRLYWKELQKQIPVQNYIVADLAQYMLSQMYAILH